MGKIISKFMICCLGRENEEEEEYEIKEIEEEKEENNYDYNFDYLDTLENGQMIKYYILKNMYKENTVEYSPSVQY
jgi:hypothetical protein